MRCYIAGPMTGFPDLNFPAFAEAAARLRALGHDAVSPAELNPDHAMPWAQCMKRDIPALCTCEGIVLLDGWERSRGARLEWMVAERLGLQVHCFADFMEALPA